MKFEYIRHNHSTCLLVYHLVFCTKRRQPELKENITVELFKLAISNYPLYIAVGECMPNHVHLMIQAPASYAPSCRRDGSSDTPGIHTPLVNYFKTYSASTL